MVLAVLDLPGEGYLRSIIVKTSGPHHWFPSFLGVYIKWKPLTNTFGNVIIINKYCVYAR